MCIRDSLLGADWDEAFSGELARTYGWLAMAALGAALLLHWTYRSRTLNPASTAEMLGPSR